MLFLTNDINGEYAQRKKKNHREKFHILYFAVLGNYLVHLAKSKSWEQRNTF